MSSLYPTLETGDTASVPVPANAPTNVKRSATTTDPIPSVPATATTASPKGAANYTNPSTTTTPATTKPNYQGEPGPQEKRKCQDVIFLVLFLLFWVGMATIGGLAIKKGNLQRYSLNIPSGSGSLTPLPPFPTLHRLKFGNDTEGNLCGSINTNGLDLTNATFQYVFEPWNGPASYRKCVADCPSQNFGLVCKYGVNTPQDSVSILRETSEGNCTFSYKSMPIMNRCIPDLTALTGLMGNLSVPTGNNTTSKVSYAEVRETSVQIMHDIYEAWKTILM